MAESGPTIPRLWFKRLEGALGLPTWFGAIVIGAGPFLLLEVVSFPLIEAPPFDLIISSSTLAFAISLFAFYTGTYLRKEITSLTNYARTMLDDPAVTGSHAFSNLASVRWTLVAYAILLAFAVPLFALGNTATSLGDSLIGEVPFIWFNFVFATFFWTFGYSMYAIYKMGKMPLRLRPYTQDRTLGLRPFASASLNSTLIYLATTTSVIVPVILGGSIPVELALLFLGLYPIGMTLFFLPLLSLHGKLVEAKREALVKVSPRYQRLVEIVNSGGKVDQEVANEMAVVDKVQRDAQQIRTWPFDTGIIARLLAILVSVTAILLSGFIRTYLPF